MRPRTGLLRFSLFALALTLAIPARAAADESPSRKDVQMVAPALDKYTQDRLLGDVWKRSGLSRRDRSVVKLAGHERRYHQGAATLEILTGAELAVWPGQSVALIAPSGTGKSTLLHIAGLLEHPDAGEVYVDGTAT